MSIYVVVDDVCPDQAHAILSVMRRWPLRSREYLFDMKSQQAYPLRTNATNYIAFLDRHVFDHLLDTAASQSTERK